MSASSRPSRLDEAGLDLGRPEIEPQDGAFPGGHRGPPAGGVERGFIEGDDGFGRGDVGHERADDAGAERAKDRSDLVLTGRDADRHRQPSEPSRVEGDDSFAQGRADEPPIEVERGDQHLADRLGRVQVVLGGVPERRDVPGRPADPEQRDVDPIPELDDGPHPRVRDERPLRAIRRQRKKKKKKKKKKHKA